MSWIRILAASFLLSDNDKRYRGASRPGGTTKRTILTAILQAIWEVLTLPLSLLGIQRKPTARDVASALLSETPPAAAEPEPAYELGELIREHASRRFYGARTGDTPLAELPALVEAWLDRMDRSAVYRAAMTPARLLEAHVAAGPAGQLQSPGLVVPHPDVPAPAPALEPEQTETPSEVLAALGFVPVHRAG